MLSPRISPSLSNGVVLRRPVTTNSVIVALPNATTRVEEWIHGKAREGSTVNSHKMRNVGGRSADSLLACNLSLLDSAS